MKVSKATHPAEHEQACWALAPQVGTGIAEATGLAEPIAGYAVHPAAALFPLMVGAEFEALVDSIARNGQLDPVCLQGDVLIEGRNRARAIEILKARGMNIELRTVEWQPDSGQTVAEYVSDKNLHRRHLTSAQRAQIAADLLPLIEQERAQAQSATRIRRGEVRNPKGHNQHSSSRKADSKSFPPSCEIGCTKTKTHRSTVGRIAAIARVSTYAADQAVKIKRDASPEQVAAVKSGIMKPRDAVATIATGTRPHKPRKPKEIHHPYRPQDEFEREVLQGWLRLVECNLGIVEKSRARRVLRAIFAAEEQAEARPSPAGQADTQPPTASDGSVSCPESPTPLAGDARAP